MNVLVVNAGSSSLKYQFFDTTTGTVVAKGNCERIGIDGKITHKQLLIDKVYTAENRRCPTMLLQLKSLSTR